jgi:hypothetical protein
MTLCPIHFFYEINQQNRNRLLTFRLTAIAKEGTESEGVLTNLNPEN